MCVGGEAYNREKDDQREKEKGGTGWNERVKGKNALPMLQQKFMQNKLVQRSRSEEKNPKKQNMPTALGLQPFLPVFFILIAPTRGLSDQVAGGAMSSDTFASSHRVPCL